MDFYYRKLMGNGTVASKFRLNVSSNPSDVRGFKGDLTKLPLIPSDTPIESVGTHHPSNCVRCYKLKKKCSRTYPKCLYCLKTGSQCEYIDRRTKKHKLDDDVVREDTSHSLLIASLVHKDDEFENIDMAQVMPKMAPKTAPKIGAPGRFADKLSRKIVALAVDNSLKQKLLDEFLAIKAIPDERLPSAFAHTFFANYEWKYPFMNSPEFMATFRDYHFEKETFVNLDVYLIMAVGCIIYDANNNTRFYEEYFSDKLIESIVDIISYDVRSEEDLHTAHLLILLSIYAVNASNANLVWNIMGFLNRLLIFLTDFVGNSNQCMRKRCFWTIFNLDKELSLMFDKPSQFMPAPLIKLSSTFEETLYEGEDASLAALMTQGVVLHQLQDRMISLRLGMLPKTEAALVEYSADLEKWRIGILLLVHSEYADLPLLPNFIGLVNLDYYYLLIELDQLSATESFQFTLQFLSNSFSLLLSELTDSKGVIGTSLYSLFWFHKFFKVVEYNLLPLVRIFASDISRADLSLRLSDFNSNLQLIVNLLKFLLNSRLRPEQFVGKLEGYVAKLNALNSRLMGYNVLSADKEQHARLVEDVAVILE